MNPSILCPVCGSGVPASARFCPVCKRPRTGVEAQLRQAATTTGQTYDDMLRRAQEADASNPQPYVDAVPQPDEHVKPGTGPLRSMVQGFVVVGAIGLVLLFVAAAMLGDHDDSPAAVRAGNLDSTPSSRPNQGRAADTYRVQYRAIVTDSKTMSLIYSNAQGGTQQDEYKGNNWIENTWTEWFTMRAGDHAYVSAQNGNNRGTVTCQIYVDGQLWKSSASDGGYTIATCSGRVGS